VLHSVHGECCVQYVKACVCMVSMKFSGFTLLNCIRIISYAHPIRITSGEEGDGEEGEGAPH
jgi:hypothetical protein